MLGCNKTPCNGPTWGSFSKCSKSCGGGTKSRVSDEDEYYTMPCNTHSCETKNDRFHADIIFALDSSASMSENKFFAVKQFAMDIISALPISPLCYVGAISFSTRVKQVINLNDNPSITEIMDGLWNMPYLAGDTGIADALNVSRHMGIRRRTEGKVQILVLVTDGYSNVDPKRTQGEAVLAHNSGLYVTPIGVNLDPRYETELRGLGYEATSAYVVPGE